MRKLPHTLAIRVWPGPNPPTAASGEKRGLKTEGGTHFPRTLETLCARHKAPWAGRLVVYCISDILLCLGDLICFATTPLDKNMCLIVRG